MAKKTSKRNADGSATASKPHDAQDVELANDPISVSSAVRQAPADDDFAKLAGDQKLIERARKQYMAIMRSELRLRGDMKFARKFRLGTLGTEHFQWPEKIVMERQAESRPVITINRVAGFVDMARNMGDQANLVIKVNPVDNDGDPAVANVLAGLIRNVEVSSAAEDVYSTAGDAQCEMGRGYIWIRTDYEDDDSWNKVVSLHRVLDPLRVKVDASAQEKDQSDAEYAFFDTDLDAATWDVVYGENGKKPRPSPSGMAWSDAGQALSEQSQWFPSHEKISIKHWFCAEYTPDVNYQLKDGKSVRGSDLEKVVTAFADEEDARLEQEQSFNRIDRSDGWLEKAIAKYLAEFGTGKKRKINRRAIKWRVIDAQYVHAETEWPTPWQPFVPVVGNESEIEGEKELRGVVTDVIGSQKAYNVHVSSSAEFANDLPKAPYVGPQGTFGDENTAMRKAWAEIGSKKKAFVEYKLVTLSNGQIGPPPQRVFAEGVGLQTLSHAIAQAESDMKATARLHDATMGERGPQESGRAITSRQRQDEMSNSHYTRNRRSALVSVGNQLIRIFRVIYDAAQIVRITGADDQKRKVMVFAGAENDPRKQPGFELPPGVKDIYDIGVGRYDVEVSAAPNPGTRRQEDITVATEVIKLMPPAYAVNMMDLILQLLDTPVGRQMAERANKMLPPGMKDETDENGQPVPQIPPEIMQQLQMMKEREGGLIQALKEAQAEMKSKRLEYASKKEIEAMKLYVELVKMVSQEESADRRLLLQTEINRINTFLADATQQAREADQEASAMANAGPQAPGPRVAAAPELA